MAVNELEQVLGGLFYREYEAGAIADLELMAVSNNYQGFGLGTCIVSSLLSE